MNCDYGPIASAYHALKGMVFAPSNPESVANLIAYLEASGSNPELLAEAQRHADAPEDLECDFNRMCIGPYRLLVPPYESVYCASGRQINTDDTVKVADFYQNIGLVIDEKLNEPADYIGNELEFLYCVEALVSEHQKQENSDTATALEELAQEFLSLHLGTWYQKFTEGMEKHAQTDFWRLYAGELRRFLSSRMTH
ncbi:chaperone TorD involved in molybdoenzyme TorA maturation [Ferrimonas sediminum]|uniref:Chaperone TorD involved in molybdoenzyme TorA maturation n=1 Tax=Ferrimonas sediminum TaxID=718193 RepID=A0A1G8JMK1_9GAMM|nr:molecular chaperone TorD family protein [Ferrimonas sediminum]SDI32227.1 chaperone TorD involved in molybdoenzyme TorA maturation [Ferrimonas sediminum]